MSLFPEIGSISGKFTVKGVFGANVLENDSSDSKIVIVYKPI
jgi:hypothetical protein